MDITDTISKISHEMGVPLEERDKKVYRGKGDSSLQMAEVFHQGDYYGYLVLSTDEKGEMEYCAYSGKHPVLVETKDWRDELGLQVQRDERGTFRVDTNPTEFLGWDRIDPEKLSKEEDSRRIPYVIGFGAASCHMSNHRLQRRHQNQE